MTDIRESIKDILVPIVEKTGVPPLEELQGKFDASGLEAEIEKRLGFKPEGLSITIVGGRRSPIVEIVSDNLIDQAGIMKKVFKEVTLDNFSGSVGIDKEDGKLFAWVPVHMSWTHNNGGTNGGEWFTSFYFFETGEWEFRD